ncbi:hypothetical protein [uncultured Duncaniella sp.]|jgi:hypothetical protein|uniref:hypothetical protein n=1 Tax=uncultured Duncaniella sp. TaxID=2768039 RepID=UPI002674EBE0|nr:hypothetical protein [uncultured Duncaniella sp.]
MKRYFILLALIFSTIMSAYSQSIDTAIGDISEETYFESCSGAYEGQSSLPDTSTGANASSLAPFSSQPFDYKQTAEWGKYKALRAVGWTAFGVGTPITLVGLVGGAIAIFGGYNLSAPWIALLGTGGVLTLSSVPILISAYHYRNKAKKMSLNLGVSSITTPSLTTNTHFTPALSFALNF